MSVKETQIVPNLTTSTRRAYQFANKRSEVKISRLEFGHCRSSNVYLHLIGGHVTGLCYICTLLEPTQYRIIDCDIKLLT